MLRVFVRRLFWIFIGNLCGNPRSSWSVHVWCGAHARFTFFHRTLFRRVPPRPSHAHTIILSAQYCRHIIQTMLCLLLLMVLLAADFVRARSCTATYRFVTVARRLANAQKMSVRERTDRKELCEICVRLFVCGTAERQRGGGKLLFAPSNQLRLLPLAKERAPQWIRAQDRVCNKLRACAYMPSDCMLA